eukprot:COSAG06_NODE_2972_length_6011_cov_2.740528_6_plen_74_part_00
MGTTLMAMLDLQPNSPRMLRMRPKKPESIVRLSLMMPGRKSLSCTTPFLTPAASQIVARSVAFAVVSATGFSA